MDRLVPIIEAIARDRGWRNDWLNNKAVMFIPTWGQAVKWEPILEDANVSIAIAPLNALLAMKLKAARPGRDTEDIAKLLALNNIDSVVAAESVYESFYPGDALPERAIKLLEHIILIGPPPKPQTLPSPTFQLVSRPHLPIVRRPLARISSWNPLTIWVASTH